MLNELPEADRRRSAIGLSFLVAGILLVLWAWGNWMYRTVPTDGLAPTAHSIARTHSPPKDQWLIAHALLLLVGFLFFLVVLLGSFVLARAVRRRQAAIDRRRSKPTEADDVWSRHRLPSDDR